MAFIRNVDNLIEGLNNKFFTEARARAAVAPDIAVEQQRAQAAEAAEQSARQAADSQLQSNINAEQSARQSADSALSGRLDVVEGTGNGSIKKSLQDAKDYADLKVTNLINGAPGALDTLKEIADQLANDESAVGALTNTVAANLVTAKSYADGKVAQEVSDRQAAISSEQSARQAADSALGLRIDGVQGDLSSEVSARQSAMSSEQAARQSADQALSGRVGVLEQDPTTKSYVDGLNSSMNSRVGVLEQDPTTKSYVDGIKSNLQGQITQEISDRHAEVVQEQQRAEGAEQALDGRLDVLEQDPTTKSYVDGKVVMLEGEISKEISDRQAAVSQEASARHVEVEAEKSRAMGVEAGLQSAINQEIGDRQAAISSEALSRSSADAAEMSARQSADNALSNRIGILEQDPTTKTYVDGIKVDLQGKVDKEISDRQADVNAEESRAMSAESGLSSRIGVLEQDPTTKTYVDSKVNQEKSERQSDVSGLNIRLGVLEQDPTTKAYVDQKITNLINGAPQALDTLKEISDQLANDESVVSALTNTVSLNLQAAKDYADGKVSTEQSRAQGIEAGLRSDLNSEIANRQSADSSEAAARAAEDLTMFKQDGSRQLGGNLLFSAETFNIGASSANRPNLIYTKSHINSGGRVFAGSSSSGAPGLSFSADSTTGINCNVAGSLGLIAGGATKFSVGGAFNYSYQSMQMNGVAGINLIWSTDGGGDIGNAANYRPNNVYVKTSVVTPSITIGSLSGMLKATAGVVSGSATTSDLTEGSNLYYTQARFDSAFAAKSSSDLAEGTKLFFTDARAKAAAVVNSSAGVQTDQAMSVSAGKSYTDSSVSAEATLRSNEDATLFKSDGSRQLSGNMLFSTDGTLNIGSAAANRPNNVYVKTTVAASILTCTNGITMGGGQTVKYVSKAANYTLTVLDYLVAVTDVSVSRVMTLPTPGATGTVFIIKDQSGVASSSNYIQIAPPSGKTIDGQSDYKITVPYESVMVVYNGSNFIII
jgi:hypothetical protein